MSNGWLSMIRHQSKKNSLCPSIAFSERVDRVQRGQETCRFADKVMRGQILKVMLLFQIGEECRHLALNVFGITKGTSVL